MKCSAMPSASPWASPLMKLYKGISTPDFVQMSQSLIFLDEPLAVTDVLEKLSNGSEAVSRCVDGLPDCLRYVRVSHLAVPIPGAGRGKKNGSHSY